MTDDASNSESGSTEFINRASADSPGIVREFLQFLVHNKKWWLIPIVVSLLLIAALLYLSGAAASVAPFIYPLF